MDRSLPGGLRRHVFGRSLKKHFPVGRKNCARKQRSLPRRRRRSSRSRVRLLRRHAAAERAMQRIGKEPGPQRNPAPKWDRIAIGRSNTPESFRATGRCRVATREMAFSVSVQPRGRCRENHICTPKANEKNKGAILGSVVAPAQRYQTGWPKNWKCRPTQGLVSKALS